MLVIAYYDNMGYYNMVRRMNLQCEKFELNYKNYNREWLIKQEEFDKHIKLFSSHKGGGYWAWKPLIIRDALQYDNEILYLDSSVVIPNKEFVLRNIEISSLLSAPKTEFINANWTKLSCFVNMGCTSDEYLYAPQVWAGMIVAKRGCDDILSEWKHWCLDYETVSDTNKTGAVKTFMDHRHDQSILTNLLIKYNQSYLDSTGFSDVNDFSLKYIDT